MNVSRGEHLGLAGHVAHGIRVGSIAIAAYEYVILGDKTAPVQLLTETRIPPTTATFSPFLRSGGSGGHNIDKIG